MHKYRWLLKLLVLYYIIINIVACSAPIKDERRSNHSLDKEEIRIISIEPLYFQQDDPAIRITYETTESIDNLDRLRSEACGIINASIVDIERQRYRNCLFRARERSTGQIIEKLREYTFVLSYNKNSNSWSSTDSVLNQMCSILAIKTK